MSTVRCSAAARLSVGSPRYIGMSAMRSSPGATARSGRVKRGPAQRAEGVRSPGSTSAWTSSMEIWSKPSALRKLPRTRKIFQAGRDSPMGFAATLARCTRPSQLTKVPADSVNAAMGRSTSAYSSAASLLKALI